MVLRNINAAQDHPVPFKEKKDDRTKFSIISDNIETLWGRLNKVIFAAEEIVESKDNAVGNDKPNSPGIHTHPHVHTTLVPEEYDKVTPGYGGGYLNMSPTTLVFTLAAVVQETLTFAYNSDDEISTVTNVTGDIWTATYTTLGQFDKWIKT